MAKARKEEVRTTKIHLELDYAEASVLLTILEDHDGFESAGDIADALDGAGVLPFVIQGVFSPLVTSRQRERGVTAAQTFLDTASDAFKPNGESVRLAAGPRSADEQSEFMRQRNREDIG